VNPQQELDARPVGLGLETPSRYEVKSGLKEGDLVMVGSRSEIKAGERVETKLVGSGAQKREAGE
jgi:hypothetical protein